MKRWRGEGGEGIYIDGRRNALNLRGRRGGLTVLSSERKIKLARAWWPVAREMLITRRQVDTISALKANAAGLSFTYHDDGSTNCPR